MRFLKYFLISLIIVLGLAGGAVGYGYYLLSAPSDDTSSTQVIFRVKPGESISAIGEKLEAAHLVRSALAFRFYVKYQNLDSLVQHGKHKLTTNLALPEIAHLLTNPGANEMITVTIPEGKSVEEIAEILAKVGIAESAAEVITLARDREFAQSIVGYATSSLEGYLFPETYVVGISTSTKEFLKIQFELMNKNVLSSDVVHAKLSELQLNELQWITLASMVEAEARVTDEQAMIASLYYSRFKVHNMPMECDPTVKYGLRLKGMWKGSYKDSLPRKNGRIDWEAFDDPYNTYHSNNRSLPPGPIGSPGKNALLASLEAKPTQIKFMYADAAWNGLHCFSETSDQHSQCINKTRTPSTDSWNGPEPVVRSTPN